MITKESLYLTARVLRVNQWIKNLVVLTAILFSGNLFQWNYLSVSLYAFINFCLLSSASYILNDIIDYKYDKNHPVKKNRPLAAGKITVAQATFFVFILTLVSLLIALGISIQFFLLALGFIILHFLYSLYLKKYPLIDIFTISFSFMIRTFAGEVVSGYHIPIWLLLTIFFISLFMATIKRHAELKSNVKGTRESLYGYKGPLLDFLTYVFATATLISYATYTYVERPPAINGVFSQVITSWYPDFEARKWMMITIPVVVYGLSRYAQLLYEKSEGERPEKIITTDKPLIITMALWGIIMVALIYVL